MPLPRHPTSERRHWGVISDGVGVRRPQAIATSSKGLAIAVTPSGQLSIRLADAGELDIDPETATRLAAAFAHGVGAGLLQLGAAEVSTDLPASLRFWRELGARYVAAVCARGEDTGPIKPPGDDALAALAASAPPMLGGEYLDARVLAEHWRALDAAFADAVRAHSGSIAGFLASQHSAWHLVGRVCFNLAENRGDDEAPFAFLATYTTRLSTKGTAQHVPLGQALREYAGARAKPQLQALLEPVRRAAESCAWLAHMVERGELFHPLRWTAQDALGLLGDVPKLEAAGVVVRMPARWGGGRPSRPQATATVGSKSPGGLGGDALLDFRAEVTLDGEPLTEREIADLLAGSDGLRLLRGRWVR